MTAKSPGPGATTRPHEGHGDNPTSLGIAWRSGGMVGEAKEPQEPTSQAAKRSEAMVPNTRAKPTVQSTPWPVAAWKAMAIPMASRGTRTRASKVIRRRGAPRQAERFQPPLVLAIGGTNIAGGEGSGAHEGGGGRGGGGKAPGRARWRTMAMAERVSVRSRLSKNRRKNRVTREASGTNSLDRARLIARPSARTMARSRLFNLAVTRFKTPPRTLSLGAALTLPTTSWRSYPFSGAWHHGVPGPAGDPGAQGPSRIGPGEAMASERDLAGPKGFRSTGPLPLP